MVNLFQDLFHYIKNGYRYLIFFFIFDKIYFHAVCCGVGLLERVYFRVVEPD